MKEITIWRFPSSRGVQSFIPSCPSYFLFRILRTMRQDACVPAASAYSSLALPNDSWSGLRMWRSCEPNENLEWGTRGPQQPATQTLPLIPSPGPTLADCGRAVLLTPDPTLKIELTHAAWRNFLAGALPIGEVKDCPHRPLRPSKPELLPARQIPSQKQSPLPLNVYMLHNLAHVELNAIDLAWDTVVRFSSLRLPLPFYSDFARVADDEARHLGWCLQRLEELGHEYGCMPAHDLLWTGCAASAGDVLDRLAVVPMTQEARGLDAGCRLAERLVGWGDNRSASIVSKIAEEERAHVAVGVSWFRAVCTAQEIDPGTAFAATISSLCPDLLKGQFNHAEREEVGLMREWYDESHWTEDMRQAAAAASAPGSICDPSSSEVEGLKLRLQGIVATELHASSP